MLPLTRLYNNILNIFIKSLLIAANLFIYFSIFAFKSFAVSNIVLDMSLNATNLQACLLMVCQLSSHKLLCHLYLIV